MGVALPKVGLSALAIDCNATIAIGEDARTSHSRLAPSHTVVVLTFDGFCQGRLLLLHGCINATPTLPRRAASTKPVGPSRRPVSGPHVGGWGQRRPSGAS